MKRIPAHKRSATLRYYYRQRKNRLALGLTCKGTPRKRVWKKYFTRAAKRRAANEHQRRWHNRRTKENNARGLTERGTVRINRQFPELRGLASRNRKEYQRRVYHILKKQRTRSALAALLQGGNQLITKLK